MRKALTSLGLTLSALGLLGVLVVLCTLGQVEIGTFNAIDRYFRAFALWWRPAGASWSLPVFPAGGAVGLLLFVNLVATLLWRLPRTRPKAGLWLVHGGLTLFVVGEYVTGLAAVEAHMAIEQGQSLNYAESPRRDELVVSDLSAPDVDTVYAVRQEALSEGRVLSRPDWPFTLRLAGAFKNAAVGRRPDGAPASLADSGLGPALVLKPLPDNADDDDRNRGAAFVSVLEGGRPRGTWLVSSELGLAQEFTSGGRRWSLAMRPEQHYLPFTITLKKFSHDLYAGTAIPKNFSSLVRLTNPATGEDRDVLIYMNNPLRYGGRTFYQASFGKGDTVSVLQVVRNPGWLLPYASFTLVALGLLLHFGLMLRRSKPALPAALVPAASGPERHAPWAAAAAAAAFVAAGFIPPRAAGVDAARFGRLPVLDNGRVKPLDSIARNALLVLSGKQVLRDGSVTLSASRWLLEAAADPQASSRRPLFLIQDPDLLGLIGRRQESRSRFSWAELEGHLEEIAGQAARADKVEAKQRTRFEAAVHTLNERLFTYHRLRNTLAGADSPARAQELAEYELALAEGLSDFMRGSGRAEVKPTSGLRRLGLFFSRYRELDGLAAFKPIPPLPGAPEDAWRSAPAALLAALKDGKPAPELKAWAGLLDAARAGDGPVFAAALSSVESTASERAPGAARRASYETWFNLAEPFYRGLVLYVAAFLAAMASFLAWGPALRRAALWLMGSAFAVHTAGLAARMALQGRPPVTNLYSSAIFVGWIAVLLSLLLERRSRRGFAAAVGGLAGFATLIIAHHLAASGDTLEMMQAVLDSNFWLGTHVVAITVGYAGTFLAGLLAHAWILRRWWAGPKPEEDRALYDMTYGVVCFALLFSFIGTVLGGIWADQSWGRFWGWDPKENGAFLIVLWNAVILHARMGGYVRERGFMALAVLGDVVTALSWFGVNMLGIGLHSYGFMDKAAGWLGAFCALQLLVAASALRPAVAAARQA